ncbi:hypothetical protein [Sphingobacterium faecium]|uniref:hypothetical protein n=1 Tax=Sphingobacterium faecium TaxID=34087 RepID=UPI00247834D9|nr:hypothetical protein [Sphingobacterium faecium]WGQ15609.1 hypothetical protein QG727_04185 [Sphingobacterium faecium]
MQLTTVRQAITSELPQIGHLAEIDPVTTKATIAIEVEDLLIFLNIGKVMNDSQIAQTIDLILVCYPELNLADVKLFFMWMKKGEYGKFYDRMDGSIILEAMEAYNLSKIDEVENIHREIKMKSIGGFHPKVIEVMNSAVNEYRKRKIEKPEAKRVLTDAELFYQRALKQFDNLHIGNDLTNRIYALSTGIRALRIGTEVFTIQDFVNRKIHNKINSPLFDY